MDIVWFPTLTSAFLVLELYQRVSITRTNSDLPLEFPLNQFPVRRTDVQRAFHVSNDLFIQKVLKSELRFKKQPCESYDFFSVRPNEWFRY